MEKSKLTNKEVRRFAQMLIKNLKVNIEIGIKVVEMLNSGERKADIDLYILSNGATSMANVIESCFVDVNSEKNITIGKSIYYKIPVGLDMKTFDENLYKVGELKFINDKVYFDYK